MDNGGTLVGEMGFLRDDHDLAVKVVGPQSLRRLGRSKATSDHDESEHRCAVSVSAYSRTAPASTSRTSSTDHAAEPGSVSSSRSGSGQQQYGGVIGRHPEHDQHVFGDAVGGLGVVALRLVLQLTEPQQGAAGDGQREDRIVDGEPAGARRRVDVARNARGASPRSDEISASPRLRSTRLISGLRRNSRPVEPEAAGERFGRILAVPGQPVQQRGVGMVPLVDRGLEKLFLAVESLCRQTMPTSAACVISSTGTFSFPRRDERLRGPDEGRPSARLASFQAVLRRRRLPVVMLRC